MSAIEKDIRNYISDVGRNLVCSRKLKKQILKDIENDVLDYTDNKQITDINEIYAHFGTPEEIAKAYLSDAEPQNIKKAINVRKVIIAAVVAIIMIYLGVMFFIVYDAHNETHGYFTESVKDVTTLSANIALRR